MLSIVTVSPFEKFEYAKMLENMNSLSKIGFKSIELTFSDAAQIDANDFNEQMRTFGLKVSALGTGKIFGEDGLSFSDSDETVVFKAVERVKGHLDFLKPVSGSVLIIGLVRGRKIENQDAKKYSERFVEIMRDISRYDNQIKIAIEPLNRYETNFINTVDEGLKLTERIGCSNVGLLLDTFHMNIEETSIVESIAKSKDRLFHFHVADSNRLAPGFGHIDFENIFSVLHKINYKGAVSAEIIPKPDYISSAEQTYEFCKQYF